MSNSVVTSFPFLCCLKCLEVIDHGSYGSRYGCLSRGQQFLCISVGVDVTRSRIILPFPQTFLNRRPCVQCFCLRLYTNCNTLHPNAHVSYIKSELGAILCAAIVMASLKERILRTIGQINGGLPPLNRRDAGVTRRQIWISRGEEYVHYHLVVCNSVAPEV